MQSVIILITALFFFPMWWYMLRRDDLAGMGYGLLFLYTIFTEIGYSFFPELSAGQLVYFGRDAFYPFALFMLGSFIATFLGLSFCAAPCGCRESLWREQNGRFRACSPGVLLA
jgi:hypothetical protein